MSARMPLFRGEPAHIWVRRLELRGWPTEMASRMARFLTEKGTLPPAWEELVTPAEARSRPARPRRST